MKEFFEYIKTRIETNVPAIKTVRMFNNQLLHSNEKYERNDKTAGNRFGYRNEKAFKYPACFVEFIVQDTFNYGLGIRDYLLTVRFRFAVESYKFERLDTFDFVDDFDQTIQLMSPMASGLTFTTFQELSTEFDEDFNNVEAPYKDFRTRYRSSVAYSRRTDVLHGPVTPVIESEIVLNFNELTVDTTEITADSELVTADQTEI